MNDIAIKIENLSKFFRINIKEEVADTIIGKIKSFVSAPSVNFRNLNKYNKVKFNKKNEPDIIWALKRLSLEIKQGEVVGIIGRNGAGKSTLLKILSRIIEPTSGRIIISGRVSSLLEVGTGFHPDLTGRENVYLNGSILGMTKGEIDRKFDEIVNFSGVKKFIDTPVKRYSSGMQVRLAFSVAAHLEPEILLVDEVLAVGDGEFQKKCLGKLEGVSAEGRTVLFVSHNLGQIKKLCSRGLLIKEGKCIYDGPVDDAVAIYQKGFNRKTEFSKIRNIKKKAEFISWRLLESTAPDDSHIVYKEGEIAIEILIKVISPINHATHALVLRDEDGVKVGDWVSENIDLKPGVWKLIYTFPLLPLRPGVYYWSTLLYDPKQIDKIGFPKEMIIATKSHHTKGEKGAGILNIGHKLNIKTHSKSMF